MLRSLLGVSASSLVRRQELISTLRRKKDVRYLIRSLSSNNNNNNNNNNNGFNFQHEIYCYSDENNENNNNSGSNPITNDDEDDEDNDDDDNNDDSFDNDSSSSTLLTPSGTGDNAPRYPQLMGLPIVSRPIFPSIPTSLIIKDVATIDALEGLVSSGNGCYLGTFLRQTYPNGVSDGGVILDTPEVIEHENDLYKVGTFCQILRMTKMEDPASFAPNANNNNTNNAMNSGGGNMVNKSNIIDADAEEGSIGMEFKKPVVSLWLTGHRRIDLTSVNRVGPPVELTVSHWDRLILDPTLDDDGNVDTASSSHIQALTNEVISVLREVSQMNALFRESLSWFLPTIRSNAGGDSNGIFLSGDAYRLADFVASLSKSASPAELQAVLEERDQERRLHMALVLLNKEKELAKLQQEISQKVEETMTEQQRKYFLQQQLKSIQRELGMEQDDKEALINKYQQKLEHNTTINDHQTTTTSTKKKKSSSKKKKKKKITLDPEVQEALDTEFQKLATLEKNSSEFNVTRAYLDWLCAIPWGRTSPTQISMTTQQAKAILDKYHYGMKDVKETILQFLAVRKLNHHADDEYDNDDTSEKESFAPGDTSVRSSNKDRDNTRSGTILCLAGPPGVGKTSIAKSIAEALGREYYRFSVGGLSDVSELKGHRRTYLGSMPGKIIQCLKAVGVRNPVVLIDEIDKLGVSGYRGDPSAAFLEILDPSQNHAFRDHYLDVPVDLSGCVFLCTANEIDRIPGPLLDRMEVIQVSGYDSAEKIQIAQQYLVPKAMTSAGLFIQNHNDSAAEESEKMTTKPSYQHAPNVPSEVEISEGAIEKLVRWYAREAGVRNLAKLIDKITRKLAFQVVVAQEQEQEGTNQDSSTVNETKNNWSVAEDNLDDFVGKPLFTSDRLYDKDPLPNGIVMGLAYTSMGGSALYIETQAIHRVKVNNNNNNNNNDDNKKINRGGNLQVTGQLGDVMKESTKIAHTVARARLASYEPTNDFFETHDMHLHVPEGATPKDGPSAGVTMVTSLLGLAGGQPVRSDVAMTGEISLTGKVLPVGGIREKSMAARRAGINVLCLPHANEKDWDELPDYLKEGMEVHFCHDYDQVYRVAFNQNDDRDHKK